MARLPAPTKANLFKAQRDLRFATEGCDLLHQKRDVLVMELMSVAAEFSDVEKTLRAEMLKALECFTPAYLTTGEESMERLFTTAVRQLVLDVEPRSVMGTFVPSVNVKTGGEPVFSGVLDTSPSMDAAINEMRKVMEILTKYIEIVGGIWRLATEVEKTQRRINAIENVFIPESQETVNWIRSAIEESDREELFRRKLLKKHAL